MKKFWYVFMLIAVCLAGCNNTDDLEDGIDDLKKRVTSLETQINDLNNNIEAIRELCKEGKTITNIDHTDGVYTLTLSDGSTLKLVEKTSTSALFPLIGINDEGNWQVSYDNGNTYTPILVNGQPVKAKGEDGITPKFRVNNGYWEVSTDGNNYTQVKDENGNPVKAIPDASSAPSEDSFFQKVENTGSSLEITLKDGTVVSVPVVKDFFCYFDESYTGIQKIAAGNSKEFDLHIKGAENVSVIAAPAGWTVEIGDAVEEVAKVKVTAPSTTAPSTRAIADNTKDIAILASKGVHAQLTKIQVETTKRINYKEMYDNGSLIIEGVNINSTTFNKSIIVNSESPVIDLKEYLTTDTPTVLFLTGNNKFTITAPQVIEQPTVIIGQYEDELPEIECNSYFTLKNSLIFKNVKIITRPDGYTFNGASATVDNFIIEDCQINAIKEALYFYSNSNIIINNICFKNSKFQFANTKNIMCFNISSNKEPRNYKKIVLENNIFYHSLDVQPIQLFNWGGNVATSMETGMAVSIKSNSFINLKFSNGFIKADRIDLTCENNLFSIITDKSLSSYIYVVQDVASTININDNIIYDAISPWNYATSGSKFIPDPNILQKNDTNPFTNADYENGIFVKEPQYSNYGANIK